MFNLAHLRGKTKARTVLIREILFADDADLPAHKEEELQQPRNLFVHACKEFGLTTSIKKTNVMGQDVPTSPAISIDNECLTSLTNSPTWVRHHQKSLAGQRNWQAHRQSCWRDGKLSNRVLDNNQLTLNTKLKLYLDVIRKQKNRLESLHIRCLRRIRGIRWQDKVTQCLGVWTGRLFEYTSPLSVTTEMAGTRPPNEGWTHTKGSSCMTN